MSNAARVRVSAGLVDEQTPSWRGRSHALALPPAVAAGVLLIVLSPSASTRLGACVLTATSVANFAASSALHLGRWPPAVAPTIRRLDHASIFLLIAGTYTPFSLLMLTQRHQEILLAVAWGGAALGVLFRLAWPSAPRVVFTGLYLLLGWMAVAFIKDFADFTPVAVPVLLAAGGVLYTVGGVVYGCRWPNPSATRFGFHEVFHALTVAAFAAQYVGVLIATIALR